MCSRCEGPTRARPCESPAPIAVTFERPLTATGVSTQKQPVVEVVPLPMLPQRLSPQALTVPSPRSAKLVLPFAPLAIAVTLDASGLAEGRYEADLCVRSNDPYRHNVPVHVTFDVGPEDVDTLFANGFE